MLKKFILVAFFFFLVIPVEAKVLPRFTNTAKTTGKSGGSSLVVLPRLRADRKALTIYFGNLSKVKNLSYVLMYNGSGQDQGIVGSVDSSGGSTANRELLFGTCSTAVCTYHSNITNMKLEVTVEQFSGKKSLRRYRIKV